MSDPAAKAQALANAMATRLTAIGLDGKVVLRIRSCLAKMGIGRGAY